MFKKILIAEDFGSYSSAVKKVIEELDVPIIDQVFYCDDALLKIRKAKYDNEPYDLLITDLSFVNDGRDPVITKGEELIQAVKKEFPELKIIVFSIENRNYKIKKLFDYNIDGFVTKGRDDIKQLKVAIKEVYEGRNSIPSTQDDVYSFTHQDIEFVNLLGKGMSMKEVSEYMKKEKKPSNSLSYLEKRLATLKQITGAKNTLHLLVLFVDWGLID